ncbi:hypothetical protein FisN_11Lh233 [Fistulifera solaris]|uniref:Threonine synthase n=1 Tax=Fistulifera solaris TaxID=1519565 RepID=A0A1Z5J724_FISSO|nr:hypothetical protein FisN_11Lh233 [Fistulifera solaris]|eukprot:GAX09797.1 hypothetical protein FisN_11Lh233 [Fistulifera solaris]
MRYTSTRNRTISCTFEEAICSGYAPDGGLFVPETLPAVSVATLKEWAKLDFAQLAQTVLRLFVSESEVSAQELSQIVTYEGFAPPVIPIQRVGSLYVAELFHGPTFCFKDLGMRAVVRFLSLFATKRRQRMTLLVSTTGDTGPAAVQAVSDARNPWLTILVHYPAGQISSFQRKQLTTTDSPHVHVVAFEGGGDDMDRPIKNMLKSAPSSSHWTGVNSYNIGRPLMQMIHYIWTYLRVAGQEEWEIGQQTLDIILPTGAMGNLAGGYMAKKMGIPLGKLCSGVNVNDITHRVMQTGAFHSSPFMLKTLSEAINIQIPYNFERILFYLTEQDDQLVREWMTQVETTQKLDLSTEWLEQLQQVFDSARISDKAMCTTTRQVWKEHHYLMDPHTAVAMGAAETLGYSGKIAAVFATASPCKFEESVTMAVGKDTWDMFAQSDQFPATARAMLLRNERPPTIYRNDRSLSLYENQRKWEEQARQIIATFENDA